jgi:hypothetical protein
MLKSHWAGSDLTPSGLELLNMIVREKTLII